MSQQSNKHLWLSALIKQVIKLDVNKKTFFIIIIIITHFSYKIQLGGKGTNSNMIEQNLLDFPPFSAIINI